jgi:predicted small lipoprotein YifL
MKKGYRWVVALLLVALLAGCSGKPTTIPESSEPVEEVPTLVIEEEPEEAAPTEEMVVESKTPPPFCEDQRVIEFAEGFIWAIQNEDAYRLGGTITNRGGLNIRLEWWNTNVHFTKDEVVKLFDDDTSYDWGIADGSGAPVQGSFMEVVQPKLLDVVEGEYVIGCDTLDFGVASGPSAGLVTWPDDVPARHYIAIYRPAPADQDMDWRTWVLGFEYLDGIPYISYLVQYHWEI